MIIEETENAYDMHVTAQELEACWLRLWLAHCFLVELIEVK